MRKGSDLTGVEYNVQSFLNLFRYSHRKWFFQATPFFSSDQVTYHINVLITFTTVCVGRGDRIGEQIGIPTFVCGEIGASIKNQRLLVNGYSVNKLLTKMPLGGSSTMTHRKRKKEFDRCFDMVGSTSKKSTEQDDHIGSFKDATENVIIKKRHQSELESSSDVLTEDCKKPLLKSSPAEECAAVVLPVGTPANEETFTRSKSKKTSDRKRTLSENARKEMSDPVCPYDMSGVWTFEGFQHTVLVTMFYYPNRLKYSMQDRIDVRIKCIHWQRDIPHGAGLVNKRNICFANSVLQSLVHIPPFTRYTLEKHIHSNGEQEKKCVWCMMRRAHYSKIFNYKKPYLAKWVVELWPSLFSKKYRGSQEDAHEFFLKLADALKLIEENSPSNETSPPSPIDIIFGGKTRYETTCAACGDKTVRYQKFLDLSLPLPETWKKRRAPNTTDLLSLHMQDEQIECNCSKCGSKWKTMSSKILRCPSVLLLHILRFSGYKTKSSMRINIEKKISLRRFTYLQDDEDKYELSAAIFHIGSYANRGHYTVMAKGFDNRYYYFDDIHVKRVHSMTMFTVLSSYMLFYSRTRPQKCVPITEDSSIVRSKTSFSSDKISSKTGRNAVIPIKTSLDKPKAQISSSFSPKKDVIKATESYFPSGNTPSPKSSPSFIAKDEESSANDSTGDPALKSITTDNIPQSFCFKSAGNEVKNLSENTQNSSSFLICDDDHYDVGMNTTMEGNENIWNSNSHGEKNFKPGESGTIDTSDSINFDISCCENKFGKLDFTNADGVNNNVGCGSSNRRSSAFNGSGDDMEKHGKGFAKDRQARNKHSTKAFRNQDGDEVSGHLSRRRKAQVKL
ncbi:unnamed protein product [Angiostrongylus costaricensis]|uniref:Ubiquitin carboxyl-terminal hydrolase 36 n=1 Tax=Angiostrongylus costaricensis TaxID=334426 RepID=A0A0R3P9L8_ANGCS|nr:unnamed protein product [Angiostrongylus costaricensis]